jgi:hypothetical protein
LSREKRFEISGKIGVSTNAFLRAAIRPPDEDEYADNPANAVKAFACTATAPEIKRPGPGFWCLG